MARIIRQTTVVRDGRHNAFTDLAWWQGLYWVSYRKGAGHVSADGEATLAVSADRERFREVAHLKVPGDNRDPKLVPLGGDRLAMIFPSWDEDYERLRQYVALSENGFDWDKPRRILPENRWLWRVRPHEGRYYGMSYGKRPGTARKEHIHYLEFLVSDDLLEWKSLSQIGDDEMKLGESDVHFRPNGEAWVVSRSSAGNGHSYLSRATPPYAEWECNRLDYLIHAPVLLEHGGALYVSGRRRVDPEQDPGWPFHSGASLGVWCLEEVESEPVLHIPATGDCSYPGLIEDPDGRICLSYYSQHAYDMGVVSARCRRGVDPPQAGGQVVAQANVLAQSDIYFAELELP